MEPWEKHYHLSSGRCFEMYSDIYKKTIRFKVISASSHGGRTAKNCETGERFDFVRERLLKREYGTLREIDCSLCKPQKTIN